MDKQLLESVKIVMNQSLYESILLLEDKISWLKERNPTIDTSHDQFAQHKDTHSIIDHLAKADPTPNKIYTPWVLNQYKKKNIRQEDVERVNGVLSNFHKYKGKLDKKDINQYQTVADVKTATEPHIGTAVTKKEQAQESEVKGRTLIHSDPSGLKVYKLENNPHGEKVSQDLYGGGAELGGCHTDWCTAARSDGGSQMFKHYSEKGNLYVIHTPSGSVYQAHPKTEQLMDKDDRSVDQYHPEIEHISKALDHIPDGSKLKIANEIPGKIDPTHYHEILAGHEKDENYTSITNMFKRDDIPSDIVKQGVHHENNFVKISALNSNKVDPDDIRSLIKTSPSYIQYHVIRNSNTPKDVLKHVIDNHGKYDSSAINAALRHKNMDSEMIQGTLEKNYSSVINNVVTSNPNASKENLDYALHALKLSNVVAQHLNATPEQLHHIVTKEPISFRNQYIMHAAIKNPNAGKDTLIYASNHDSDSFAMSLLDHPNKLPKEVIDKLIDNKNPEVGRLLFGNRDKSEFTTEQIDRGVNHPSSKVRETALQHSDNVEHIRKLINDPSMSVRHAAVSHPLAPPDVIDKALDDDYGLVKETAVKHPNASKENLEKALISPNWRVQALATKHPKAKEFGIA